MIDQFNTAARNAVLLFSWAPPMLVSAGVLALAVLVALGLHRLVFRGMTRIVRDQDLFWRSIVARTRGPTRLAIIMFCLSIAAGIAPLTRVETGMVRHFLLICFIFLVGWVARTAIHIWSTLYLRRFKLDAEDNLLARKHTTQLSILKRVATLLVLVVTFAAALMTFDGVRQYGVSLLASAGAAGIVVGFALQPLLRNLVAGIQLAITQPIRIDDAVIVENEWGNVEEISSTYVVVRLWDWRRMVLPLTYFIETPFQNWTRESSSLLGTVIIHVDYSAPVAAMRRKLEEIAAASALWDRRVAGLQVLELRQDTMEIRMLVSATSAGRAFDLRCEVREKLIAWLQAEYPGALPRRRTEIASLPEGAAWMPDAPPKQREAVGGN